MPKAAPAAPSAPQSRSETPRAPATPQAGGALDRGAFDEGVAAPVLGNRFETPQAASKLLQGAGTVIPDDLTVANQELAKYPPPSGSGNAYDDRALPFAFRLRKEAFAPGESVELGGLSADTIFAQIVGDIMGRTDVHPRVTEKEHESMKLFMTSRGILPGTKSSPPEEKLEVIELARNWTYYFGRRYPVSLKTNVEPDLEFYVVVTHRQVLLTRVMRQLIPQTGAWKRSETILAKHAFNDIDLEEWRVGHTELMFPANEVASPTYPLVSAGVRTIIMAIEGYLLTMRDNAAYVLSTKPYTVRDATLLSFPANVVITLDASRAEPGWLYGSYDGRTGSFPATAVVPIVGDPTEAAVAIARRQSQQRRRNSLPSGVAKGYGAIHEGQEIAPGSAIQVSPGKAPAEAEPAAEADEVLSQGKYSMMIFAKECFRLGQETYEMQRTVGGSIRGTLAQRQTLRLAAKKTQGRKKGKQTGLGWSWSELAQMVKYTRSPIQASLTKLDDSNTTLNKMALESFIAVMRFMGDYPLPRSRSEVQLVHELLLISQRYPELRDEQYCQLIKQTTSNKSDHADSCARGWRLLTVLTAFSKPTDLFERFLRTYLQSMALNSDRAYHAQGAVCIRNLKQTMKFGGRKVLPDVGEFTAVMACKYARIQKVFLPGERTKSVKIHATTTVGNLVGELCRKMGASTHAEYGVYIYTQHGKIGTLLRPSDYVLDTTTILEKKQLGFRLVFRKVMWFAPSKLENTLYVSTIFDQVFPDFRSGIMLQLETMTPEFLETEMAMLLVLAHVALSPDQSLPALQGAYNDYLTVDLDGRLSESAWHKALAEQHGALSAKHRAMSPTQAQREFLGRIAKMPLFGSRFFLLASVSDTRIRGPCILAVNRTGIAFLHPNTRGKMLSYTYNEIVSTRRLGSRESGKHFVDLKLGNLMVQRVTRCETRQGGEIISIITSYIDAHVEQQHQKSASRFR